MVDSEVKVIRYLHVPANLAKLAKKANNDNNTVHYAYKMRIGMASDICALKLSTPSYCYWEAH